MKNKWSEMSVVNKVLSVVKFVISVCAVLFALLQIFGVMKYDFNITESLLVILFLMQSIQDWKKRRDIAIFELCTALILSVMLFFSNIV